MSDKRSIEIDFEVHKAIETARCSFSETANDVLRRLLGISTCARPAANQPTSTERRETSARPQRSWRGKGVELLHGTRVRMDYNGTTHAGEIANGKWVIDGNEYFSPSAAANGVAITKNGQKTQLNGWVYWKFLAPNASRWKRIDSVRKSKRK